MGSSHSMGSDCAAAETGDARAASAFREELSREPEFLVRAPGRLDLIGAHVDYNEGPVLAMAINRFVRLAAAPSRTAVTTIVAHDLGDTAQLTSASVGKRKSADGEQLSTWALYPAGVMLALQAEGLDTPPLDVLISSDVPIGAGVSSSAAIEVAFSRAWQIAGGWQIDAMALAQLCQRAENEFVGVDCGLMDQFASVFGGHGDALLLDCRTLDWQALPLPDGVSVILADTGTRRKLTDGRLNERHRECMSALEMLRRVRPGIRALRDATEADLASEAADHMPEHERSRARHIVGECARVWQASQELRNGEAAAAGRLMDESHVSARDLYEASSPHLDAMWAAAHEHGDCLGGRTVGAGFAGCQVFLVWSDGAASFAGQTARKYESATGIEPRIEVVRVAGDG